MLGAFAALYQQRGLGFDFWGWILPHGITELTAVIVCGAAGLVLARAVILPGRHGRLHNLARAGRSAGILVLGAVVMFLVAAAIEGFFRQLVNDPNVRYAVAVGSVLFWGLYFTRGGWERA